MTDPTGDAAIDSYDPLTRRFNFHYDQDLFLSGGPGVEYLDYLVTVTGTSGEDTFASVDSSFNLRLRNPCFDPAFVSI